MSRSGQRETRFTSAHRMRAALANSVGRCAAGTASERVAKVEMAGPYAPTPTSYWTWAALRESAALGTHLSEAEIIPQETIVLP